MRLNPPVNNNYCATVVRIKNLIPLPGCDNLMGTNIFGFQAIVSKKSRIGDAGLFFPAETQLSAEYSSKNNLYRHGDRNVDHDAKGYLEDNARVKAIKFRGNVSNGLFMPLSSVDYLGVSADEFSEGDEFDEIQGFPICNKYVVPTRGNGNTNMPKVKKESRVDAKFMPEHFSTDNYFKNSDHIDPDHIVIVTQKIHGTSIRIANTIVNRKKTLRDRIAEFFGVQVQPTELAYVFGSRKVIKDANNPDQAHYYEEDIWTNEGKKLEGMIPENYLVFGELVGWTAGGAEIQKDYTYNMPPRQCKLYVYRVAFVNDRGLVTDLTWDQVVEFCGIRGIATVPEIWRGKHKRFKVEKYLDKRLKKLFPACLPLDKNDTVDEGVCIRVDGLTPKIYKAKGPKFFEHETKVLDAGTVDLESEESNPESNA